MTRAEWDALIARVEAAEGPDRELDAYVIAALVGGYAYCSPFNGKWCVAVGKTLKGQPREWEPRTREHTNLRRLWLDDMGPTASLDAAASLVGEWLIASLGDMVADGLPGAVLLLSTDPVRHVTGIGHGTRESGCLARALTAAALRAQMAMQMEGEG